MSEVQTIGKSLNQSLKILEEENAIQLSLLFLLAYSSQLSRVPLHLNFLFISTFSSSQLSQTFSRSTFSSLRFLNFLKTFPWSSFFNFLITQVS